MLIHHHSISYLTHNSHYIFPCFFSPRALYILSPVLTRVSLRLKCYTGSPQYKYTCFFMLRVHFILFLQCTILQYRILIQYCNHTLIILFCLSKNEINENYVYIFVTNTFKVLRIDSWNGVLNVWFFIGILVSSVFTRTEFVQQKMLKWWMRCRSYDKIFDEINCLWSLKRMVVVSLIIEQFSIIFLHATSFNASKFIDF